MSGKVFLWATPRTCSTAFTRAILNLEDCKVFMEAYCNAYYFGPARTNQRCAHIPPNPAFTFQNTTELICQDYQGKKNVFCKEMAYYFEGRLSELESEKLKDFHHTFLIRDPKKSIPSLYRAGTNHQMSVWHRFDPEECGFRQQYEVYEYIKTRSESQPLVIVADDLMKDPEKVLKYFCDHTGLTYKEGMSLWEPGPIAEWEEWGSFVTAVFKSSGIGRPAKADPKRVDPSLDMEYPEIVSEAIQDSTWFYEQLHRDRVQF